MKFVIAILSFALLFTLQAAYAQTTPQGKTVAALLKEENSPRKTKGIPEKAWKYIDDSGLRSRFGNGWQQLKSEVRIGDGYSDAKYWIEKELGDFVVAGFFSDKWISGKPSYNIYWVTNESGTYKVKPRDMYVSPDGVKWLSVSQYELESRLSEQGNDNYKEADLRAYCQARIAVSYAPFTAPTSSKARFVRSFSQEYARRKSTWEAPQSNVWDYIDEANGVVAFGEKWGQIRMKEKDILGMVQEWDTRIVKESGDLVVAHQGGGDRGRHWIFNVAGPFAHTLRILARYNFSGRWLEVRPALASFQGSSDDGVSEINFLDSYCRAMNP